MLYACFLDSVVLVEKCLYIYIYDIHVNETSQIQRSHVCNLLKKGGIVTEISHNLMPLLTCKTLWKILISKGCVLKCCSKSFANMAYQGLIWKDVFCLCFTGKILLSLFFWLFLAPQNSTKNYSLIASAVQVKK